jgi:hypothetical protein
VLFPGVDKWVILVAVETFAPELVETSAVCVPVPENHGKVDGGKTNVEGRHAASAGRFTSWSFLSGGTLDA